MTTFNKLLCKKLFILMLLFIPVTMFAQNIRYVQTGFVDKYGERNDANSSMASMVLNLKFTGSYCSYVITGIQNITIRYKFHHRDGSNSVYYQVANDMLSGRETWVENGVLVVSPDKSLINMMHYFQGERQYTIIYEQKAADSYSTMSR